MTHERTHRQTNAQERRLKSPHEAAHDFVDRYLERGDSIESLIKGQPGTWNGEYHAQIGGAAIVPTEQHPNRIMSFRPNEVVVLSLYEERMLYRTTLEKLKGELESGYQQKGLDL